MVQGLEIMQFRCRKKKKIKTMQDPFTEETE